MTDVKHFRYGGATARAHIWNSNSATVSNVWSKYRSSGDGTQLMIDICRWADENAYTLVLTARAYDTPQRGAMTTLQLTEWYRRFGFKFHPTSGNNAPLMFRSPREKNTG